MARGIFFSPYNVFTKNNLQVLFRENPVMAILAADRHSSVWNYVEEYTSFASIIDIFLFEASDKSAVIVGPDLYIGIINLLRFNKDSQEHNFVSFIEVVKLTLKNSEPCGSFWQEYITTQCFQPLKGLKPLLPRLCQSNPKQLW